MNLILSLFPGIDLLGRGFEAQGFCIVRGPDAGGVTVARLARPDEATRLGVGLRLYTTHNLLKAARVCRPGFERFTVREDLIERGYDDDSILPLALILEVNGLDDALWALRATPPEQTALRDRIARLFACDCAEHVLPIYQAQYPFEWRPRVAIDAARRFATGSLTAEEMRRAGRLITQAPKTRAALAARATTKAVAHEAATIAARAAASASLNRKAEREFQAQRLMEYLKYEGQL